MFCTNCGEYNDDGMMFCTHCGFSLGGGAVQPDDEVTQLGVGVDHSFADAQQEAKTVNQVGSTDSKTTAQGTDPVVVGRTEASVIPDQVVAVRTSSTPVIAMAAVLLVVVLAVVLVFVDPFGVVWHRDGVNSIQGNSQPGGFTSGNIPVGDSSKGSAMSTSGRTEVSSVAEGDDDDNRGSKGKSSIVGNLINGGHIALGDDGYIYYASPVSGTDWDTRSIVRCSADGSGKTTVYSGPSNTRNLYHINVIDDRIVFNQVVEKNSRVISVKTDGGNKIEIDSCDDWSLCQVDDGWIYYLKSGRIHRCDLDGKSNTSLYNVGNNSNWRVAGNTLFTFSVKGARDVFSSDLDGKNRKIAFSSSDGYEIQNAFPTDSNTLLVWEVPSSGNGAKITRVDVQAASGKTIWASGDNIERMCAYSDGIVVTKVDSGNTYSIATIPYSTGTMDVSVAVTHGAQARYTCCYEDRIYYGVVDVDNELKCSVWSIALSGYDVRELG